MASPPWRCTQRRGPLGRQDHEGGSATDDRYEQAGDADHNLPETYPVTLWAQAGRGFAYRRVVAFTALVRHTGPDARLAACSRHDRDSRSRKRDCAAVAANLTRCGSCRRRI